MTKSELAKLEKRNARLEKKFQKDIEKAKEHGKRKESKTQKRREIREREKAYQRQSLLRDKILKHQKKINDNQYSKGLARAFGTIPPLKTRVKKDPNEFKGYGFDYRNNCFRVQFTYKKVLYRLGRYNTPEEAHAVYLEERAKKVAEWDAAH